MKGFIIDRVKVIFYIHTCFIINSLLISPNTIKAKKYLYSMMDKMIISYYVITFVILVLFTVFRLLINNRILKTMLLRVLNFWDLIWIQQKGKTFDHDFCFFFLLFFRREEKKRKRMTKVVVKSYAFLLDL